ncbi:MAG: sulfatase-like hydrolase/transferase, partial [Fimbriimonadaceae bacterium]
PGLDEFHGKDIYLTEALSQKACDVIRESKGDGKPFFMNFAPYAVHAPIMANKRYLSKYAGLDQREAAYATMIESYDAAIGELVSTLKATGEFDNTVFIFTGDNGGLSVHSREGKDDRNAPLRGGKGSIYDGGIRIPLIVHRPGKPAGRTDNRVISMDLFPSILSYAGINSVDSVDGRRIEVEGDRPLLFHMPHFWGVNAPGIEPFTSLIWGRYKLTYTHRDLGYQLYDLQSDIGEQENIMGSASRDLKIKIIGAMSRELQRMNAQMPISKETGEPIPMPRLQWSSN